MFESNTIPSVIPPTFTPFTTIVSPNLSLSTDNPSSLIRKTFDVSFDTFTFACNTPLTKANFAELDSPIFRFPSLPSDEPEEKVIHSYPV